MNWVGLICRNLNAEAILKRLLSFGEHPHATFDKMPSYTYLHKMATATLSHVLVILYSALFVKMAG